MDKLSMEEAGYRNCVSVPDGAPAKVSEDIPVEKEVWTAFQVWRNSIIDPWMLSFLDNFCLINAMLNEGRSSLFYFGERK